MSVLFWILAVLSLIGGLYISLEEGAVWLASGLVSFAILGGFATIISLLNEISSNTAAMKDELARREEQKRPEEQRKKEEEQKRLEEQRKKEEEQKRLEEQRRKEEEQKRLEEQRRREEVQRNTENNSLDNIEEQQKCGDVTKYYAVGDHVFFGSYPESSDNPDELIEWIVLENEPKRCLMLAKNALDARPFSDGDTVSDWKKSSIRNWLNNEFVQNVFSPEEEDTLCKSDDELNDRVFLLSEEEVKQYFPEKSSRKCDVTPYAIENGAYYDNDGKCAWWLRTLEKNKKEALYVDPEGEINNVDIDTTDCSVRPAIWVNLDKLSDG